MKTVYSFDCYHSTCFGSHLFSRTFASFDNAAVAAAIVVVVAVVVVDDIVVVAAVAAVAIAVVVVWGKRRYFRDQILDQEKDSY